MSLPRTSIDRVPEGGADQGVVAGAAFEEDEATAMANAACVHPVVAAAGLGHGDLPAGSVEDNVEGTRSRPVEAQAESASVTRDRPAICRPTAFDRPVGERPADSVKHRPRRGQAGGEIEVAELSPRWTNTIAFVLEIVGRGPAQRTDPVAFSAGSPRTMMRFPDLRTVAPAKSRSMRASAYGATRS